MKKLLKIKEFFHLKKRALETSSDSCRPTKRPRQAVKLSGNESKAAKGACAPDDTRKRWMDTFLQLFQTEVAKDVVWWLPGRRGEAFAMNRESFERHLLKIHFKEHSFAGFLGKLDRWGFRQMNIPSLSGRVLAFESTSQGGSPQVAIDAFESTGIPRPNPQNQPPQQPDPSSNSQEPGQNDGAASSLGDLTDFGSLQVQQARYMVQQEISHTYFSLLWQELQHQLSILLLHQAQAVAESGVGQQQPRSSNPSSETIPRSSIADVALMLHQQQIQQQVAVTSFYRAVLAEPTRPTDEPSVIRELNDLHQQQMTNLTYQIVALVAANLEHQNHHSDQQLPESSITHRVLVKYLIALVMLQLQQQQRNLEFLRQDRLTALALIRSLQRTPIDETTPQLVDSLHMQQLLAEASMLSLSRAHQLLAEAALLLPSIVTPQPTVTPPILHHQHLPEEHRAQGRTFPVAGISPSTSSPRTTAAR